MITIQHEGFPDPGKKFLALVRKAASRIALRGEVTIRLAGAGEVRALNREYRGHDRATDVLSFPLGETLPEGLYAGDILVCLPVAKKQAERIGHSLEKELLLLVIHGLLHLKGFDHETDDGEMLELQRRLFTRFNAELP